MDSRSAAFTTVALLAAATAALVAASGPACPAGVSTGCGSTQTCCPVLFSGSGFGCCPLGADAVCCGGQECCPSGTSCVNTSQYSAICVPLAGGPNVSATQVCGPGPQLPATASSGLPTIVVNGDSVSIGQMGDLQRLFEGSAFVQHSPWAGGGGADDVNNGLRCAANFWYDADYDVSPAASAWDLYSFNYGLHDLTDNSTAGVAAYSTALAAYADALLARVPPARLVYVTTTPQMQYRVAGDTIVELLNAAAVPVMAARGIEVVDLYSHVTTLCGTVYLNCSICDNEYNPATGVTCGYHYNAEGWTYLASFTAPAYAKKLAALAAARRDD